MAIQIDEHVFRFQISMGDMVTVVHSHCFCDLSEYFGCCSGWNSVIWTVFYYFRKHFSFDMLTDQVELSWGVYRIIQSHDVGMTLSEIVGGSLCIREHTQQFDFTGHTFLDLCIQVQSGFIINLYCDLETRLLVRCKLHQSISA